MKMASKNNDVLGYMDGVCVKIAEKYKPPKRIILPTNTQRLTSNDITQGPYFNYDFGLEHLIQAKMKELKEARTAVVTERDARLKQIDEQKKDNTNHLASKVRELDNSDIISDLENKYMTSSYPNVNEIIRDGTHRGDTTTTVLMPITMANNSTSSSSHSSCDTPSSTPINISDFENDTASPFDNMELKTLNDLAELAQVLQPTTVGITPYNTNYQPTMHMPDSQNRPVNGYYNAACKPHQSLSINQTLPHYDHLYHQHNTQSYKHLTESQISSPQSTPEDSSVSQAVPNIINALQKELMSARIDEATNIPRTSTSQPPLAAINHRKTENDSEQRLPNPYATLPTRLQQTCKEVSLMGFPLDRVARACSFIGEDQPRLIEHMIAMSQLLDLGFDEGSITKALLRCDNDRDKALDYLVT